MKWALVGPIKLMLRRAADSTHAGVNSERGVYANTLVPQLDGLLQRRLSTVCRYNSSTIRTAQRSSKCPVTHNAVRIVELLSTAHFLTSTNYGSRASFNTLRGNVVPKFSFSAFKALNLYTMDDRVPSILHAHIIVCL